MNRIALITGAGRGIGAKIAHQFAAQGYDLALTSRDGNSAEQVAAELRKGGRRAIGLAANASDPAGAAAAIEKIVAEFGRLDVLVNNAGTFSLEKFLDVTLAEWNRVMATNLTGYLVTGQAAARQMVKQKSGRIINVGSYYGARAVGSRTSIATAKAAVIHLTKQMAIELAADGITVNCVSPGQVRTELTDQRHPPQTRRAWESTIPMGRYAEPEDVAHAILFFASPQTSYITGTNLFVDGGTMAALAFDVTR
jgi:NAD(P)-dependent dehydrogenase (short-subunit alcohol dehydrogenase family)